MKWNRIKHTNLDRQIKWNYFLNKKKKNYSRIKKSTIRKKVKNANS
jgi:hypothetical protein